MASSSSAAIACSDPSLRKYDVFISFRGEDTRKGFTSHLHSALCEKQIAAYIDQLNLEKGDTISPALLEAIEGSAISIIVFSENYASSRWCLDELVHILKCKEKKNMIVLPIFYGVDPSHIRKQEGSYAQAFLNHEQRFRNRMEKVREWKQALTTAANLSGWDSREESNESTLVKKVVERVREKLFPIWSIAEATDDLKRLFGIDRHIEKIESLLRDLDIVGICGMGGIGKTTLARAVFNRLSNQFERSYFAANVREESNKKGIHNFANEVFSNLLNGKVMYTSEVNVRLRRKKLLLVLDDVDTSAQLQHLVGDRQFGHGSKIIITSRDKYVLEQVGKKSKRQSIYEAEELNSDDACQLFYLHAFRSNACPTEFRKISEKVVSKAVGNPLALTTLGSYLYPPTIKVWKSALDKLNRVPNKDIQKVLKISYDGLNAEEQDIFLDIACFLKNEKRDFVEGILGEHKSIIGITALVSKSLITINQDGIICMHDLIQEMGWGIVRQEMGWGIVRQSTKTLGKRSRLWIPREVCEVLESKQGTDATKGIYLDTREIEELQLRPDVFKKMRKLRLLKIYPRVYFNEGLKYLPNSLRYVHWDYYPEKSLPSNFNAHNLVELHMHGSKLEQLLVRFKNCGSLKQINLSGSQHLTEIADLSLAPKLESIILSQCRNLKTLPKLSGNLQELLLDESGIEQIPSSSIEWFVFPMLSGVCSLTYLNLRACRIRAIPDWLGSLTSLVSLCLRGNYFEILPSSIGKLCKLKFLDISRCQNLQSLPDLPLFIERLNANYCSTLEMVSTSRPSLTRERWDFVWRSSYLSFCNCSKLDENAINTICNEFRSKVFCIATALEEEVVQSKMMLRHVVAVCYPRHEIPKWFSYQFEGSSITIELPPDWYNPKTFLGFVLSVVVESDNWLGGGRVYFGVDCRLYLKTKYSESLEVFFPLNYRDIEFYPSTGLEHVFMWYYCFNHSMANFRRYQEAKFEFDGDLDGEIVKQCGVQMLYLEDI